MNSLRHSKGTRLARSSAQLYHRTCVWLVRWRVGCATMHFWCWAVHAALAEAEKLANVEICSIVLAVTGSHIKSLNNRGLHPIIPPDREITLEDVREVLAKARAVNLSPNNQIIHDMSQPFVVDGLAGIFSPEGLLASRLEVEAHIIHGDQARIATTIQLLEGLGLKVERVVFNGLASAYALLTSQQKEWGALVIDLGGGTTNYAVYVGGRLRHSGVLAVGGDHISNALAQALHVSPARAEALKLDFGAALGDRLINGGTAMSSDGSGPHAEALLSARIQKLTAARAEEILRAVAKDLDRAGLRDSVGAGVFLCGGGARMPLIETLTAQIFGVPATGPTVADSQSPLIARNYPELATPVGLLRFAATSRKR